MAKVVIGIDLGTQGARAMAVTMNGDVLGSATQSLSPASATLPLGWIEQDPQDWWQAVCTVLRQLTSQLPEGTYISGLSVDSTSGTILPVDDSGEPLYMAMMYNDQRSQGVSQLVQAAGAALQEKLGYVFGSSYALPKIVWFKENMPELFARTKWFLHAADFINGRLTGNYATSDTSNALKTGYDLIDMKWPDFIENDLQVPIDRLPNVLLPGKFVGQVNARAAEETGLPEGTMVLTGATDGTAAQMASGATLPGDWNTTLGTTLVFKGISSKLRLDPKGRVYFHLHPEGWWLPGGASNTGTDWISQDQPGTDIDSLVESACALSPTSLVRYPLSKKGERFPFIHSEAQGFTLGTPASPVERCAAGLEGVAYVERLAYETLQSIGLEVGRCIYITGGGTRSREWSQIRASVLKKQLIQPESTESAFGAAVIAASGIWFGGFIRQAAASMVRFARIVDADPALQPVYDERYAAFKDALAQRGYLE
jgi:D-ribulokinase